MDSGIQAVEGNCSAVVSYVKVYLLQIHKGIILQAESIFASPVRVSKELSLFQFYHKNVVPSKRKEKESIAEKEELHLAL